MYLITTVPAPPTPPLVLLKVRFVTPLPLIVGSQAEPAPPPPPLPLTPFAPTDAPARYVVLSPASYSQFEPRPPLVEVLSTVPPPGKPKIGPVVALFIFAPQPAPPAPP